MQPKDEPRSSGGGERRILVVDDNVAIHDVFRTLLCPKPTNPELDELEATLFKRSDAAPVSTPSPRARFQVDAVSQGRDGYEAVVRARRLGKPYALAFIDMRMPPGWDGVETAAHMWKEDPDLEIVICSAYSDYSWHDAIRRLRRPELRLLMKPFESKDVLDLAWTLTGKWLRRRSMTP
ncbi:hypothetical protein LZC95_32825 [Pendulispora brunnea]|uniref:Response regulatory domain-containing protein n=1 Tax=Pendulispora brunnea TaxID=2905690 RepID=A0ABZ2JY02_9BACT